MSKVGGLPARPISKNELYLKSVSHIQDRSQVNPEFMNLESTKKLFLSAPLEKQCNR